MPGRSKDDLILTAGHERASVDRPAKVNKNQLCVDTGCNLKDLLGVLDDSDG